MHQISLINVVMELRKLCCHPFMLEGVEPEDPNEFTKYISYLIINCINFLPAGNQICYNFLEEFCGPSGIS